MAIEWWVADEKSQNQKLSEKKHLWGHTLELLPKTPRCQLEGLRWDFPTQHKWYMSSLWCQVVTGRKFWLIQARSKLYGVFFLYPFLQKHFSPQSETLAQVRRNHGTEFHVGWSTVPKCTILCHFKRTCIFCVGKIWQPRFLPILPRDVA